MAIRPYRATTDLFRPIFDDFLGGGVGGRMAGMDLLRSPEADVMESQEEIRVMVELPGVPSDQIEVSLEDNVLTISGEKREEREEGDTEQRWHLSERRYGRFSRSFVLPREVETEKIEASFNNGILTITVPKSERAKPRRIEVSGQGGQQRIETGPNR